MKVFTCAILDSTKAKSLTMFMLISILTIFLNNCKDENEDPSLQENFIKVYYLFDISGSYNANLDKNNTPLRESILKSKEIVLYLAHLQDPKYFPQIHQIGFIGDQVERNRPSIRIEQQGIFDKPGQELSNFISSLINIDDVPPSSGTDLYAGLYKSSQSLSGSNSIKQLIIIFSDFHPDTQNSSNYDINLRNIKVLGYYTETGESLRNPGRLQEDLIDFKEILKKSDCLSFSLLHIDAFDLSQIWELIHE